MTTIASPILVSPPPTPATAEPIAAVLARLEAPTRRGGVSPIGSTLAAVCSLGLIPLWLWPHRWQAAVDEDQRDLAALAAWWRRQTPAGTAAQRLDTAVAAVGRVAPANSLVLTVAALVSSVLLTWLFWSGFSVDHLVQVIYGHRQVLHLVDGQVRPLELQRLWMCILIVAYGLHYLSVRFHAGAVKRYVAAVNATAAATGLRWPTQRYRCGGFHPMWAICAAAMCSGGLWWGLPLALAGARQGRYLARVRPRLRQDLAAQARAAMGSVPVRFGRCSTPGCRAMLPSAARFCPRCGAKA